MALWQSPDIKEQPAGGFRSLHENVAPGDRPLGLLSAVSNMVIYTAPALSTRPGLTVLGASLGARINGIHAYRNLAGTTEQLLVHAGTGLYRWDTGTSAWALVNNTLPDSPSTGENINDLYVLFTGGAPWKWNGTTLTTLGGTPPQGKYCAASHEQAFVSGISGREGDLDFCDVADPETWAPSPTNDAGSISVSSEPITWVDHDDIQDKVIIWTAKSLFILSGPETPNRPGLWSVRTVAPHGTKNGRTVQNLSEMWIWLTDSAEEKGFAFWAGGAVEVQHDTIEKSLALIDWSKIAQACAFIDERGRYVCQAHRAGGGTLWFIWDREHGWMTGTGTDIRASGRFSFSGDDQFLSGDASGQVYSNQGTNDGGTAISFAAEIGPSVLGDAFRKKQLLDVRLAVSMAAGATLSAVVSTSETGAYGTAKNVSASTDLSQIQIPMPIIASEALRSGVFRLKLSGTGVVTIHDVLFRYARGRT